MADRSVLKKNLKYHRLIVLAIGLTYIWVQYEYSTGNISYDNGQAKIDGQHINGKDEGQWTWFHKNGKIQMQGVFANGKRNGLWTIWDNKGNKLSESEYKEDKLNGKFIRWYTNGKTESEGEYINDEITAVTYYNADGTIKK